METTPSMSSAPLDVEFDVTSRCQLDCTYCSAAPLRGHDIDTAVALDTVSQLIDLQVFSLLISGGEPTLHPGILDILSAANSGIPILTVNTNGIRLADPAFAERVFESAPRALISISLDSLDENTSDAQRGAGARKAKQAIENCLSAKQPVNISCVVAEHNLTHARALLEHYVGRVKSFSFFPRVPRGEAELGNEHSRREYWASFESFVADVSARFPEDGGIRIMLPYRRVRRSERGSVFDQVQGCCCTHTRLYIDSQGCVYPCYYSASQGHLVGNIQTESIAMIWRGRRLAELRDQARTCSLCGTTFRSDTVPHRFASRPADSLPTRRWEAVHFGSRP
ncbi:radical SAM/SPASM domain-containing protein [Variovorax sp. ZT5P49]|uniref:radical SAM protein n=1 Tax=Variovorax sp. ZT5P49 TaxID=3443733 RepID=UPI003F47EFAC